MRKFILASLLFVACGGYIVSAHSDQPLFRFFGGRWRVDAGDRGGFLYVMLNASRGNRIAVLARDPGGRLYPLPGAGAATGGLGGGDNAPNDPLGSQHALLHDDERSLLFAVNAGSNTVTAFDTSDRSGRLRRTAYVGSGGLIPVSVASSDGLLYVLNAGGAGAVSTFVIGRAGQLTPLGTYGLGLANATSLPFDQINAPGQVGVDALARRLVVTHGGGRELLVAALDDQGLPAGPLTSTSTPGLVPFAFDVTRHGAILVAEAASGSVSSFEPPADGPLMAKTAALSSGQAATCWILAHDSGYVYTANTGSDSISLYRVSRTGELVLVESAAASAGDGPADITFAGGGRFLYSLNPLSGDISGFAIAPGNGHLRPVERQGGLPAAAGIQGIAARDF